MKFLNSWKVVFLGLLFVCQAWAGDANTLYKGRLKSELVATHTISARLTPAPAGIAKKLPSAPGQDDSLFTATLNTEIRPLDVIVIMPKQGESYLYADVNSDGKFEGTERVSFNPRGWLTLLKLPVSFGIIDSYAFFVSRPRILNAAGSSPVYELNYPVKAAVVGTVNVDGRDVLVGYGFDPKTGTIDLKNGVLGMDCNGDGSINWGSNNPERFTGTGKTYVFRIGQCYLSTESVDLKTGEIILRSHPASDYTRVELVPGTQIPEFTFTDLDGKLHRFSEYRGKYVLMVFWGSW